MAIEHIFRANDIRGLADGELTDHFAFSLGQAFARKVVAQGESQVMVCRDARLSSPRLHQQLLAGLSSQGQLSKVIDIGIGPTPLLGFGLAQSEHIHSGIMITASHNPPEQNGFKMVLSNRAFYGDELRSLIQDLDDQAQSNTPAQITQCDLEADYITEISKRIGSLACFKVVVDAANGAAGPLAVRTLRALNAEVIEQFCDLDGRFPHRSPDTSNTDNLRPLQERVVAENADLGIGFDGDGDRMVAVTETGRLLNADEMIQLFASSALANRPGASIVYDVKCSTDVGAHIQKNGGRAVMHRSGRSFILSKMLEENAAFAGEYSAHYFFLDQWLGTDDGIYAACRLMQMCQEAHSSLEQICGSFSGCDSGSGARSGKVATGEIYLSVPEQCKFTIIEQLLQQQEPFNVAGQSPKRICLDGLRLEYAEGWTLVRASNTSAALTLRFEAHSAEFMQALKKKIAETLQHLYPEIDTAGIYHVD